MMTMKLVTIKLIKKPKKTKLLKKTVMERKTKVQMMVKMKLPEVMVTILTTILIMMRMLMTITQMMIRQKKLKEVILNHLNGYYMEPLLILNLSVERNPILLTFYWRICLDFSRTSELLFCLRTLPYS